MSRPAKATMEISAKEFKKYEEVKASGKTNMFDSATVTKLSGLPVNKIRYILVHYKSLKEQFKDENS